MKSGWTKKSWRNYTALQQPKYPDIKRYNQILSTIQKLPPLVFLGEVNKLKKHIADAGDGKKFILQGGDCAECFDDCNERSITNKLKILLQMSVILTHGAKKPVVRIGRLAGQYTKPRSRDIETIEGESLPVFRGVSINSIKFSKEDRKPDPERLLYTYYHSAVTLNYLRAMIAGGFADLHHPYSWNLYSIEKTKRWPEYKEIVDRILDSINFMEAFGGIKEGSLGEVEFFTSHEGLLLGYEEALTKKDINSSNYYNLGAHMLWIGERTRSIKNAHIEYFRGISNPVGIKIGPACTPDEIISLLEILNPANEKGRIMLITRLGIDHIEDILPGFLNKINKTDRHVTWSCDPMHCNTTTLKDGRKTRSFKAILSELKQSFIIHKKHNTHLGAVHFELTGENVTECLGGSVDVTSTDLAREYKTLCDPRLNYSQSLEMAFLISKLLKG